MPVLNIKCISQKGSLQTTPLYFTVTTWATPEEDYVPMLGMVLKLVVS
jgi:hypothetical protein